MTRVDNANRSFLLFAGLVVAPYVLLALVGCGLLTILGVRLADHGLGALTAGRGDLRPAAALVLLLAVATGLAIWSVLRQVRATRALGERVGALAFPVPSRLEDAAVLAGLADRVEFVDADEPFSFAYGHLRPRVVVSRGLFESLDDQELRAVLEHEGYHVRHFDPLKVVVARAASAAYFFLPALQGLRTRYAAASELAADRRAMEACGHGPLAGALYQVVRGPEWEELSTAAAIGGPELFDMRVSQIETSEEPPVAPVSRQQIVLTITALATLVGILVFTVVSLGGPDAIMREAMGSDASTMGDMDMAWSGWWWLPLLAVLGVVVWLASRRRAHP